MEDDKVVARSRVTHMLVFDIVGLVVLLGVMKLIGESEMKILLIAIISCFYLPISLYFWKINAYVVYQNGTIKFKGGWVNGNIVRYPLFSGLIFWYPKVEIKVEDLVSITKTHLLSSFMVGWWIIFKTISGDVVAIDYLNYEKADLLRITQIIKAENPNVEVRVEL